MTSPGDVLDRLKVIEEAIIADSFAADFLSYVQDGTPYWTNQLSLVGGGDYGTEMFQTEWQVTVRLFTGNIGQRYDGELEQDTWNYVYNFITHLVKNKRFELPIQSLGPLDDIDPQGLTLSRGAVSAGGEQGDNWIADVAFRFTLIDRK